MRQYIPNVPSKTKEQYVKHLGLHERATWKDIADAMTEEYRLELAHYYQLPVTASFRDILNVQEALPLSQY